MTNAESTEHGRLIHRAAQDAWHAFEQRNKGPMSMLSAKVPIEDFRHTFLLGFCEGLRSAKEMRPCVSR